MQSFTRVLAGAGAACLGAAMLATGLAAPANAAVLSPAVIQPTAGATQINLVGFNDFHGRITTADLFASNVLTAQAPYGEAGTIILGNGDQVGASLFESAIQNDEPTIDALNALGVESYTQGNHEFDKGAADATGRIAPGTSGVDLAANVTDASGAHPFGEYALFTVNGVTVAVIGAVTDDVPSLVSPDGISGYTFEDPVAAVNRVAAQLSDGNAANGEAQVIVASYHEGAPTAGSDQLATNMTNATFAHLVNDTSPLVDAIYNAHTHMPYAYDAPIGATTRPVVQADAYGASIGQIVLTVDPATGSVTASQSSIIPTPKAVPAELAADPRILQIQAIMAEAKATADVLGAQVIGTQTVDATRAKVCDPAVPLTVAADGTTSGCVVTTQDDRANESNLGGIVANSMYDMVSATGRAVDIAFMNPGGLRADLLNNDGQVTYREAASVLPFANTLTYAQLTGADIKAILEQQWQPATVSRPYLQLGISDGLTYTYDPTRAEGDRILSIALNGVQLDPATVYNVVAPNFLTAGGDNFTAFRNASAVADTGLVDLESFVNWIKQNGSLPNDDARNGVIVPALAGTAGYPYTESVDAGTTLTIDASKFDLASLGFTRNTAVTAYIQGGTLAAPVAIGTATIDPSAPDMASILATIPADLASGAYTVVLQFDGSDTVSYLPLLVNGPTPTPTATAEPTVAPTAEPTTTAGPSIVTVPPTAPAQPGLANTGADALPGLAGVIGALAALLGGAVLLRRRQA
ncbi:Endonuclease YhcR [Pseudoclavibacter triregionum]|nr:Endonuclease YhcR [Pseudoclavibacter triregionum]